MAKELEMAAQAGDFEKVSAGNERFIKAVKELSERLRALLDEIEEGTGGGRKKPEPDKAVLAAMLQASRDFDVEKMREALDELEKFEYASGGDLVKWLSGQVTVFAYDLIEKRLKEIL